MKETSQVYTDAILEGRRADSPGGAELTEEEKAEARRRAVATFTSNFGRKGLARLERIFGIDDLEKWATTQVEAAVSEVKAEARRADQVAAGEASFATMPTRPLKPVPPRSDPK